MKFLKSIILPVFIALSANAIAQITSGVYLFDADNLRHELKVSDTYLIHSIYEKSPAKFIKTVGGFYTSESDVLRLKLEFNSDFKRDSISTLEIPLINEGKTLILGKTNTIRFELQETNSQDLDGQWLFATRGPDKGQKRRGEANTRKTLKYLQNGRFQWIAYDTAGMQFKGTGGGSYLSKDGTYNENIEFFSRDNNRVGTSLEFSYELKSDDWHHTGNNSKGEPMYEIWARRK